MRHYKTADEFDHPMPHVRALLAKRQYANYEMFSQVLHYDPTLGRITWLERIASPNAFAGQEAGTVYSNGEIRIRVFKLNWLAKHVAYLLTTQQWPDGDVYLVDGNKRNLKWNNLQLKPYITGKKPKAHKPIKQRIRAVLYEPSGPTFSQQPELCEQGRLILPDEPIAVDYSSGLTLLNENDL